MKAKKGRREQKTKTSTGRWLKRYFKKRTTRKEKNGSMDYKCEICGAPATGGCRDMQRRDNYISGWVERKPIGPTHFFCSKHHRDSKEIDVTLSPLAQFNNEDYYNEW